VTDIAGLDTILAYLYARTRNNMPLMAGPEEESFSEVSSLEKHPLYKKIKLALQRGKSLSGALSSVKGFPPFFLKIIKRGEDYGDLTRALEIVLDHYPVFTRFKFQIRAIYTYISVTLIFLLAFIIYFSYIFKETQMIVLGNAIPDIPVLFRLFFLVSNQYFIAFFAFVVITAFVIVRHVCKVDLIDLIIRRTPVIKRNYFRVLSLELGTIYNYNLELGHPPHRALAEAVEGLVRGKISHSLKKVVSLVQNGYSLSSALASESILANMPAIDVIGLGEATGKPRELIKEMNEFLHKYLSANLDKEMQNLFRWCVVACGILVGIGVVYVFSAIIYSYTLMLY
jgi:type II secretory pathway component PulF